MGNWRLADIEKGLRILGFGNLPNNYPRLFFPNRTTQDFVPERESRRYSLQEKAFDGLSKGRAYSAGQTREAGIVAARRGVRKNVADEIGAPDQIIAACGARDEQVVSGPAVEIAMKATGEESIISLTTIDEPPVARRADQDGIARTDQSSHRCRRI